MSRLGVHQISASGTRSASTFLRGDGTWSAAVLDGGGLDVHVNDYGAVGDGTTNDTAAIQAAIDAVIDAGGGRVRFDDTTYLVSSAISTANLCYSQITFKASGVAAETLRTRTVLLEGPVGRNAIIRSNLTGQTYSSTNGIPSVLGGPTRERTSQGYMRNLAVRGKNLNVVVADNPTVSGWNMEQMGHFSLEECDVWPISNQGITYYSSNTVLEPTHAHAVGIILPALSNYEQHWVRNCHVTGFFIGITGSEHAVVDGVTFYRCVIAVGVPLHKHLQAFRGLSISWCRYGIATANPRVGLYTAATSGSYGTHTDSQAAILNVDELDFEDADVTGADWCGMVAHVYDAGNLMYGVVRGIHSQGGNINFDSSAFTVNGGSHLTVINDTQQPSSNLTIQDENANVATGVSRIDFQGAAVSAASGSGEVVVTVPGLTVQDENSNISTTVTQMDFQGAVTVTTGTGEVIVTIPNGTGELLMQDGVTAPPVPIETEAQDDWLYQD